MGWTVPLNTEWKQHIILNNVLKETLKHHRRQPIVEIQEEGRDCAHEFKQISHSQVPHSNEVRDSAPQQWYNDTQAHTQTRQHNTHKALSVTMHTKPAAEACVLYVSETNWRSVTHEMKAGCEAAMNEIRIHVNNVLNVH